MIKYQQRIIYKQSPIQKPPPGIGYRLFIRLERLVAVTLPEALSLALLGLELELELELGKVQARAQVRA